jgi:hypothetical protein
MATLLAINDKCSNTFMAPIPRLKSGMPFKRDFALQNISFSKTTLQNAIPN